MKRLLSLTLALLMTVALFGAVGVPTCTCAEEAAPDNPYVGLWTVTGVQEKDVYTSAAETEQTIYFDFLPTGAIYGVSIEGDFVEDHYFAYVVTGENTLDIYEGDEALASVYDPETGVITVTSPDATMAAFLQRVTEDPLPDIRAMVDHSQEERVYGGYRTVLGTMEYDLIDFSVVLDAEPDEYYNLTLEPDGMGHVQAGSESMSTDIRWTDATIAPANNDSPEAVIPYTRENDHIIIDFGGMIVDYAPLGEVLMLMVLKNRELASADPLVSEEMVGTWELTKRIAFGIEVPSDASSSEMTVVVKKNNTAIVYTSNMTPAGYHIIKNGEGALIMHASGVDLYEMTYTAPNLTLTYMGIEFIFERAD